MSLLRVAAAVLAVSHVDATVLRVIPHCNAWANEMDINKLDNLITRALYMIFKVHARANIDYLRQWLKIPSLHVTVELRKQRFMDKLIGLEHFTPIL